MNGLAGELAKSLVTLAVPVIIGYLVARRGWLSEQISSGLSRLIMDVLTPALIFSATVVSISAITVTQVVWFLSLAIGFTGVQVALSVALIPRGQGNRSGLLRFDAIFGNLTYVALPLSYSLFGAVGVVYSFLYALVHDLYFWTVGPRLLSDDQGAGLRKLLNPCVVALVLSVAIGLTGWRVPDLVLRPLELVGQATIPLALLVLGASFRGLRWERDLFGFVAKASLAKLVLFPGLLWLILFGMARLWGGSPAAAFATGATSGVLLLHIAAPAATFSVIMANRHGKDARVATVTVLISTMVSAATIAGWFVLWRIVISS